MPDIHLTRAHSLGLPAARALCEKWSDDAQERLGMSCTLQPGDEADVLAFSRSGVSGTLTVTAEAFELHAKLGFLLASFAPTIEAEIGKKLDALLGAA